MTSCAPLGLVLFLVLSFCTVRAELTLEELRAKFESAVEMEKLEHGVKTLKLRDGYLSALEGLKGTLGSEEKLEQAAQVLAEIEAVKAQTPPEPLPENADYRFSVLRSKWDRGREAGAAEHQRAMARMVDTYLKLLADRKSALTRSGDIKGALAVEQEEERVSALGMGAERQGPRRGAARLKGSYGKGNLALAKNGAKAVAPRDGDKLIDGEAKDYERMGSYAYGVSPCQFSVELPELRVVDSIKMLLWDLDSRRYKYRIEVSPDGEEWDVVDDHEDKGASGWRRIEFEPRDVRFVRVKGFGNNVNRDMHIVEVEVYSPAR